MAVIVASLVMLANGDASYNGSYNLTTAIGAPPESHYVIGGGYTLTSGGKAEASCEEVGLQSTGFRRRASAAHALIKGRRASADGLPQTGFRRRVPIAKREGADTLDAIRDLEIPNEDLKIIERMIFKIIDEIASSQILPLNQAFVKGGDIMHNVFSLHTAMQAYAGSDNLKLFLLMDCTKGFNLVSHVWTARVLDKMGLPAGLRRMVERLLSIQRGILSFGGMRHHPIEWKCGFRQGGPLSAMLFVLVADPFLESLVGLEGVEDGFGFCDDWQAIMSDIASADGLPQTGFRRRASAAHALIKGRWASADGLPQTGSWSESV